MNLPIYSQKITVINRGKVAGALQSPCCIVWLMNVPYMVAKAVFHTLNGSTCICSYTLDISIFDQYLPRATSFLICSWSGKGVTSFFVFSFRFLPSITVQSLAPPFLKMQSIGAAWETSVSSHHPALL